MISQPLENGGWIATHEDVSERLRTEEHIAALSRAAEAERQRLELTMNSMPIGVTMYDREKRLIAANARYVEMYALPTRLAEPGTHLRDILEWRLDHGRLREGATRETVDEVLALSDLPERRREVVQFDDRSIHVISHQPLADGGWVSTHEDVTDRQNAERLIEHMATHDSLTELANRRLFVDTVADALKPLESSAPDVAVLCIDLDRFRTVNDALGYPVGDRLLIEAAGRLAGLVDSSDLAARIAGDEFAIVQAGAVQPAGARRLARRIVEALRAPYDLDGTQVVSSASIGISIGPVDGDGAVSLLRNAHIALDRAKAESGGSYRFFEPDMDSRMQARRALELDLRKATEATAFELNYQPVYDLATDTLAGFEALLRWPHPDRGYVPPDEFIPVAEEIGLIEKIGGWVLKEACREAAGWPSHIQIAVNLSPKQFGKARLLQTVTAALSESGLTPGRLELEITESVLLEETESTIRQLHQLHALGVHISMDDFGTGYSSLSYLQKFRFDKIKLDRHFVMDICDDDNAVAVVRAVVGLGKSMGILTTAEGVETQEQLDRLRAEGFNQVQGFLTGRPMSAERATALVAEPAKSRVRSATA